MTTDVVRTTLDAWEGMHSTILRNAAAATGRLTEKTTVLAFGEDCRFFSQMSLDGRRN